jgi:hypothetical protein
LQLAARAILRGKGISSCMHKQVHMGSSVYP